MSKGVVTPSPHTRLLTPTEAAQHLGLTVGYLAQMRSRSFRRGPQYVKAGRLVRYERAALQTWAKANRRG